MAAYSQDIDRCLARNVGDGGLGDSDFGKARAAAADACRALTGRIDAGTLAFANAVRDDAALTAAIETAMPALGGAAAILVIGTGGSSLGAKALTAVGGGANIGFLENADPDGLPDLPADHGAVGILAVSKSGGTAEVIAHLALLWDAFTSALGDAARTRFVVLTGPQDSPLRQFAAARDLPVIVHDPDLGGRYAGLGPVGLVPAHFAGLDTAMVRAGAAEVLDDFHAQAADSAPARGAAVMAGLMQTGRRVSVLMPYADRLRHFSRWYCQLWAESLGKGGHGAIPYPAVGAVDQHSQLQLWLDGPDVAAFTLLAPEGADGETIDSGGLSPALDGRSLGDLIAAQFRGTADSLAAHGRPVRTFDIHAPAVREREIGALMMHFMLETALTGHILGVDPFDQPAVEDGKRRTLKYLSGG